VRDCGVRHRVGDVISQHFLVLSWPVRSEGPMPPKLKAILVAAFVSTSVAAGPMAGDAHRKDGSGRRRLTMPLPVIGRRYTPARSQGSPQARAFPTPPSTPSSRRRRAHGRARQGAIREALEPVERAVALRTKMRISIRSTGTGARGLPMSRLANDLRGGREDDGARARKSKRKIVG
jgi:hypothetical protein